MPTIDQLDPAVVAADDDLLPVSQGGTARRITRAQLLAGTQAELSFMPGLLGRSSSGFGPPERLGVGGGLRLADGMLWSPPLFSVAALLNSSAAGPGDLVALSQAGQDRAVPVSALLSVPGVDISGQVVKGMLGGVRKLADWVGDALPVEAFGAVGDGNADDTAAFGRALASGRPIRLGACTYRVDGQWSVFMRGVLLGTPGVSTIRRTQQSGGAWISVSGPSFVAAGITFDAGSVTGDSWGVLIGPACNETLFENCTFANSMGATLGTGLTIQARDGVNGPASSHTIRNCVFRDNAVHGLWVQAAAGSLVANCSAYRNGCYGLCLDYNDPQFAQVVRHGTVIGCRSWGNQRGISIGNYNETNTEPPRWGLANPDAIDIVVTGNACFENSEYAIAVSGDRIQVHGNQVILSDQAANGSGILVNARRSLVAENIICGPGQFGIDAGGCLDCEIRDNLVQDCQVGINAGGSQGVRVRTNRLDENGWGITAYQMETDGHGQNFGMPCINLRLDNNLIRLSGGDGGGIFLVDGPSNVSVFNNDFLSGPGSNPSQALWAHTDSIAVQGNRWNGEDRLVCNPVYQGSSGQMQVPDVLDRVIVTSAAASVTSIVGQHQAAQSGQISFIRVSNGGSGYTRADVSITGSGTGAQAQAYLRDGVVVGIALSSGGTGYDLNQVVVSIVGDGLGATAEASVGLPIPDGRRLTLQCIAGVRFQRSGSVPLQDNWTGTDISVPAGSEIIWTGVSGGWQATSFACADYLRPVGNGSVSLHSTAGDISLQPGAAGQVRIASAAEPGGFVSALGRGSPEGVIAAPPGSDYRNLDGGAGITLWLKRTGAGSSGWAAIA